MNTKKPIAEKLTIGLDLGDRRHHACILDEAGEILAEEVIVNTREVLSAFCGRYPGATFIMETGTHSPWVSRLVSSPGHPVLVANARKLRAISQSQTKSDREDAQMLARLGRADPKLLCPIRHRREDTQRALVRLKVREALVRNRVNLINSVRFLLKSLGLFVSSSIKAMAFTRKVRDARGLGGVIPMSPSRHESPGCGFPRIRCLFHVPPPHSTHLPLSPTRCGSSGRPNSRRSTAWCNRRTPCRPISDGRSA